MSRKEEEGVERRRGAEPDDIGGPTPARAAFEEIAEETVPPEEPARRHDAHPPAEAPPAPPVPEQRFDADGVEWIARVAGEGMGGTGFPGRAHIIAIHFFRADDPDTPVRETLTAAGRFEALYDEELRQLLHSARPIVDAESRGD